MKRVELEYYDVTSIEAFGYDPDKPPLEQCYTFKVLGEIIFEDDKVIVICTEKETSAKGELSDKHPYREVTIIPKDWFKNRTPIRGKKK